MEFPTEITFRHMAPSAELETIIHERAVSLKRFGSRITSCRIVVEPSSRKHRNGNLFAVHVYVMAPGGDIVVTRQSSQRVERQAIIVAIRDAFDATRRRLEDYVRRQRGAEKTHTDLPHARVRELYPDDNYGVIESTDGSDIYFHRNSVLHGGYDRLRIGTEVSYVEEQGRKGSQASTVKQVGRHGHA